MKKAKGTNDIFGKEIYKWQFLEEKIREKCMIFGLDEIRTPMFEFKDLFMQSVGKTTDIVQKEMFTFKDRGEREYALKPEGTASTVRAYLENNLNQNVQPTKLFYITQAFRDERNQAGRYKQFNQFGIEIFGSFDASSDAELISFAYDLFKTLNIKNITLKLNSLGGNECRKKYNIILKEFLKNNLEYLCTDCKSRYEKNPLRILDCKNKNCQNYLKNVPTTIENLDTKCLEHFNKLKKYLDALKIPYEIDEKIVRGLDYYTNTVFEFLCETEVLGSQNTICAGGRYDNLIKQHGGTDTGAVGFAIGIERLIILMEEQNLFPKIYHRPTLYIGSIGEDGFVKSQEIAYNLRKNGIFVEYDIVKRSIKAQLKYADKINAKYVIIIGENELKTGKINLKEMDKSIQKEIDICDIEKEI